MDTNHEQVLHRQEAYKIVGCAIEVLKELGPGLLEKPYENALVVEFQKQGVPYAQQQSYPIIYKGVQVGEHIPDLIAYGKIVVDTKCVDTITPEHRAVMLSYLRLTSCRLGLYLNFKRSKLETVRTIL